MIGYFDGLRAEIAKVGVGVTVVVPGGRPMVDDPSACGLWVLDLVAIAGGVVEACSLPLCGIDRLAGYIATDHAASAVGGDGIVDENSKKGMPPEDLALQIADAVESGRAELVASQVCKRTVVIIVPVKRAARVTCSRCSTLTRDDSSAFLRVFAVGWAYCDHTEGVVAIGVVQGDAAEGRKVNGAGPHAIPI